MPTAVAVFFGLLPLGAAEPDRFSLTTESGTAVVSAVTLDATGTLTVRGDGGERQSLAVGAWHALARPGRPRPAMPGGAQVVLTTGDRLAGGVVGGNAKSLKFQPELARGLAPVWDVPLVAVSTVWWRPPASPAERDAAVPPWAPPKGDTLQSALGQVTGRLVAVDDAPQRLRFRPTGADVLEVPRRDLRCLVLDPGLARRPRQTGPQLQLVLRDGSRLRLAAWAVEGPQLTGKTLFGAEVLIPMADVWSLEPSLPRDRVADAAPTEGVRADALGQEPAVSVDRSRTGAALTLRESSGVGTYDDGFQVAATTRLTLAVPPGATRLTARVGVDPAQPRPGRVRVSVLVDGKPASGGELSITSEPVEVSVAVGGAKAVTLVTEPAGVFPVGAVANWVGPRWRFAPAGGNPK